MLNCNRILSPIIHTGCLFVIFVKVPSITYFKQLAINHDHIADTSKNILITPRNAIHTKG